MENNNPVQHYSGGALPDAINYQFNDPEIKTTNDFINPFNDVHVPDFAQQQEAPKDPVNSILENLASAPASRGTKSANTNFDWNATRADRYVNSSYYKELGFDPNADNETKYGERQTWGNVMSNAFVGGAKLAGQSFMQGWEGWGDMANAMFNWNSDKSFSERLLGSPEDLEEQNAKQEEVMNKYAIFSTPDSESSVFNKHFFGNMLQMGGMAVGATAQFLSEEFLTAGISSAMSGTKLGLSMAKFGMKALKAEEVMRGAVEVGELYKDDKVVNGLLNSAKRLVPLSETAEHIFKANQAGAGALQMAYIGAGGIKRGLAEANMAFTQGRMLAAGTYGDLFNKLKTEYIRKNGQEPIGDDLNKIVDVAQKAALGDFYVNSGVQMVANRIQFGNLFDKFGYERQVVKDAASAYAEKLMTVTGKMAGDEEGKVVSQVYEKGFLGAPGKYNAIAKDFGAKTAAWEVTKDFGKGMFKWETTGGIHMLMQDVTGKAFQDYYYDLYHDQKGMSMGKSLEKAVGDENSMSGVQSFLMGALTGRLLSPFNKLMEGGAERVQERLAPAQFDIDANGKKVALSVSEARKRTEEGKAKDLDDLNAFLANPKNILKDQIAGFKVQAGASEKMTHAAHFQDEYNYQNAKDSALANVVAISKRTDMYKTILDTIKDYGKEFNDPKAFKEAFGLDMEEHKIGSIPAYFETIAGKVKEHGELYDKLMDKYGDLVQPELYKEGTKGHEDALITQKALHDSIEMLATNKFKSERALERMVSVSNDLAKNKTIGQSSVRAVDVMGSERRTAEERSLLMDEISSMKRNPSLGMEGRRDLKFHEQQLDALNRWKESYDAIKDIPREQQQLDTNAAKAYTDYLRSIHEQQGRDPHISEADIHDSYRGIIDHVQLNKDYGDYVEAFNTIAKPSYFLEMNGKMRDAIDKVLEERKKELAEQAGATTEPAPEAVAATVPAGDPATNAPQKSLKDVNAELRAAHLEHVQDAAADGDKPMSFANFIKNHSDALAILKANPNIDPNDLVKATTNVKPPDPAPVAVPAADPAPAPVPENNPKVVVNGHIEQPHNIKDVVLQQNYGPNSVYQLVIDKNPKIYADKNRKVVNAAFSVANKSDNYDVIDAVSGKRERTGTNKQYEQAVGTSAIVHGTPIYMRAELDTNFDEYHYLNTNELQRRTKADYFDEDNKIHEHQIEDFPIAIYSKVNGKEVKIGNVRTVKWIDQTTSDGKTSLNVAHEMPGLENNVAVQRQKLVEFRKEFYKLHNQNSTFVWDGAISDKSEGTLRTRKNKETAKVSASLHPDTQLGVIMNGHVFVDKDVQLASSSENTLSNFDYDGKEGWPVAILDTPTGRKFVSYLNVPKLASEHSSLVMEAWKAFHRLSDAYNDKDNFKEHDTKGQDYRIAQAIYNVYGSELMKDENPSFLMLRNYINDHITHLSSDSYDAKDKSKEGKSAFNISEKGVLIGWSIDRGQLVKDAKTDRVSVDHPNILNAEKEGKLNDLLSKLYYTVKVSGEENHGINSSQEKQFPSIKNGELKLSDPRNYNGYISDILETTLDKGVAVNEGDPKSQWNYFANPVMEYGMDKAKLPEPEANLEGNTPAPKLADTGKEPSLEKPVASASLYDIMKAAKEQGADPFADLMAMNFGETPKDIGYGLDDMPDLTPDDYRSARTIADNIVNEEPTIKRNCQ
jgi:hypothetical protein